tara:strand:- start:207590 stop:208147 length:558 start_codon:yes stop_codon:yes gene_type:complete
MKRVILLHGVGSSGSQMESLVPLLAQDVKGLEFYCPDGPEPCSFSNGRQWFSVAGVNEENRPERVRAAMPAFRNILEQFGDPKDSLLVGFSQGTIMALHAVADGLMPAGVIGVAGRLAGPVASRDTWPLVTLLHGSSDPIMPLDIALETYNWLARAGSQTELQVFDGVGHQIDAAMIDVIREHLR